MYTAVEGRGRFPDPLSDYVFRFRLIVILTVIAVTVKTMIKTIVFLLSRPREPHDLVQTGRGAFGRHVIALALPLVGNPHELIMPECLL